MHHFHDSVLTFQGSFVGCHQVGSVHTAHDVPFVQRFDVVSFVVLLPGAVLVMVHDVLSDRVVLFIAVQTFFIVS